MKASAAPRSSSPAGHSPMVAGLLADMPRLELGWCSEATFRRFRSFEVALVALADDANSSHRIVTHLMQATIDRQPAAVISWLVDENPVHARPRNRYARIDLVITDPSFRGLGLARLLVIGALHELLESRGAELYSISCLAAHKAIERILEDLGFSDRPRGDKNYTHEEMRLDDEAAEAFGTSLPGHFSTAARLVRYRLRQGAAGAPS